MKVNVLNSPLVPARSLLLAIHEAFGWLSSNIISALRWVLSVCDLTRRSHARLCGVRNCGRLNVKGLSWGSHQLFNPQTPRLCVRQVLVQWRLSWDIFSSISGRISFKPLLNSIYLQQPSPHINWARTKYANESISQLLIMPSVVDKASQFSLQHKRYAFANRYFAGKKRFTKLCHQFNFSSLIQHRRLVYQRSDMPQQDSEEQVFVTRNKRSSASPEPTQSHHSQQV